MRLIKQSFPSIIVLISLLIFAHSTKTETQVQAYSYSGQPANTFYTYLPLIIRPIHIYLPFVSNYTGLPGVPPPEWLGPNGGSAVTLDADPNNGNIFYAGSFGAGIFKTFDAGTSWISSSSGLGNLSIDSFAIDPQNSDILYAGTHGGGVYRSDNAGETWYAINNGLYQGAVVYSIAVNPGNSNVLYAGTRNQGTVSGGTTHYAGRLYKSVNGGASWYSTMSLTDDWPYSIAADANHPEIVIAAIHASGPYISSNYGETWRLANISSGEWFKGRAIAFDPRASLQRAYYATWHGDFYISSNDGANWAESNSGLGTSHIYPNGIAINPNNPDTLFLAVHSEGPAGVMKSTNSGGSWSGAGLSNDIVYSVATSADTLLAGTYQDGIYRSLDGGTSWSHVLTGVQNVQVTGLAFPKPSIILAGTLFEGVRSSADGGKTWNDFNDNLGDSVVNKLIADPTNASVVYALTNNNGLRRVDLSQGTTWQGMAAPLMTTLAASKPSPFTRREPLDDLLSLDEGHPTTAFAPPSQNSMALSTAPLLDMAFAPSNPQIAYLGSAGAGLYTSKDGGLSWESVGLEGESVYSIAVDPQNPDHLYVVTDAVQESWDGGRTWATIPLMGSKVNGVALIKDDEDKVLYAGTSQGLWAYQNQTWTFIGLPGISVQTLAGSPANLHWLFAGTTNGAYLLETSSGQVYPFTETQDTPIQSIAFDPADPYQIYFGTVYRSTVHYTLSH